MSCGQVKVHELLSKLPQTFNKNGQEWKTYLELLGTAIVTTRKMPDTFIIKIYKMHAFYDECLHTLFRQDR